MVIECEIMDITVGQFYKIMDVIFTDDSDRENDITDEEYHKIWDILFFRDINEED